MKGWRAALLRFDRQGRLERIEDGLLVVDRGHVVDADEHARLAPRFPDLPVTDWRGLTIAPGFIDLHAHAPQLDVIGAPSTGLLDWLERCALPEEARFSEAAHAAAVASAFLDELLRNGVTGAMLFSSSHDAAVHALFEAARARSMRVVAGKVLMDAGIGGPLAEPAATALASTESLIERWHGVDRLGYALTPRFAPSCSGELLRGVAAIAARRGDLWLQTHAAENRDEVSLVARMFPQARSYVDLYERFGLLRPRSVLAHCIHIDHGDRARLAATGASVAVCPTSNLFLGSGLFDFTAAADAGFAWGLASDVGAGTSLSPFRTMLAAYEVGQLGGRTLRPEELWRRHTLGAAHALGLDHRFGNLAPGMEADFIALDASATPLLARRTLAAKTLADWLFALIVLGDDRAVRHAVVFGEELASDRHVPTLRG